MKHPFHESGDPANADGSNSRPLSARPFSETAAAPTRNANLRLVDSWAPRRHGVDAPRNTQNRLEKAQAASSQSLKLEPNGRLTTNTPPTLSPTDPRWVLARRAAETMEGQILRPEKRERLIRLGKVMGLSPFDAHMVLAVVQDQARRGIPADSCPAAGIHQLALISPGNQEPAPWQLGHWKTNKLGLKPWLLVGLFIATEAVVVAWWLSAR